MMERSWIQLTQPPLWAPMQLPWLPARCPPQAHLLASRRSMQCLLACGMLLLPAAGGLLLPALWWAQGQSRQPAAQPFRAFRLLPCIPPLPADAASSSNEGYFQPKLCSSTVSHLPIPVFLPELLVPALHMGTVLEWWTLVCPLPPCFHACQ